MAVSLNCGLQPIEDSCELYEGKEVEGEFLVTSADAALAFDALERVLQAMTELVVTPMPPGWPRPVVQIWDAGTTARIADSDRGRQPLS